MTKNEIKESLKKIIRPLLQEVTMAPSQISRTYPEPKAFMEKIQKALKDDAVVVFDPNTGKLLVTDCNGGDKFTVVIDAQSDGVYKVTSIKDDSERVVKQNQSADDVIDFAKDLKSDDEKETYVGKASKKNVIPEKSKKKEKEEDTDECVEVKDVKKQVDFKPEEAKERKDDELVKGTAGMTVPKKVTKQVDADTKEKVKLKADTKNKSDGDLVLKLDGTSKMSKKELKESMKAFLKKKLQEAIGETSFFKTNVTIEVNGKTVPDVDVEVEYQVKRYSIPDRHDRGNVSFDDVKIISIVADEDLPEFGIKKGQLIKEDDVDIDDLDQKAAEQNGRK